MTAIIQIANMRAKVDTEGALVINTCNNNPDNWQNGLSPFSIGPCPLFGEHIALNMENGWQFTKLYAKHADAKGNPTDAFWEWAQAGFANPKAIRFPMGRGAKPLHAWWDGQQLGYIDARKQIYAPLYAQAVQKTAGFAKLKKLHKTEKRIILRDFDGYDHDKKKMTLTQVLNTPKRKMGHAFVLKMLLTNDIALKECDIR